MLLLAGNIRAVFWWALIPAALAVVLLIFAVQEPPALANPEPRKPISFHEAAAMPRAYWAVVGFGVVFSLARFSEAFLVLRANEQGLALVLTPVVLVVMNLVYAAAATPAGSLSDRIDRRLVLAAGLVVLIAADLVLAFWSGVAGALVGVALWGLHLAPDPGPARRPGGRLRAAAPARHGLRRVQPGRGRGVAGGEHGGGPALGPARRAGDLPGRGGVRRGQPRRAAAGGPAKAFSSSPVAAGVRGRWRAPEMA